MKSRKIKMTIEEFHRLPFRPAWKQEYYKGFLIETPREAVAHATVSIQPRLTNSPVPLRHILEEDQQVLLPCFKAAFEDAFEFCDYTPEKFEKPPLKASIAPLVLRHIHVCKSHVSRSVRQNLVTRTSRSA